MLSTQIINNYVYKNSLKYFNRSNIYIIRTYSISIDTLKLFTDNNTHNNTNNTNNHNNNTHYINNNNNNLIPVVGLEIHARINAPHKLFSGIYIYILCLGI